MQTHSPSTAFACADRLGFHEIEAQSAQFIRMPLSIWALDAVPDIFLILNAQRQIVFANQALVRYLNLESRESVNGLRPGEALRCVHAQETAGGCGTTEFCTRCGAMRAIVAGLGGRSDVEECRMTLDNGEALDLRVWSTPVRLDNDSFTVFTVKDISDEKRRRALERVFFHDILNTASGASSLVSLLNDATPEEQSQLKADLSTVIDLLIDEINAQRELVAAENHDLIVRAGPVHSLDVLYQAAVLSRGYDIARGRRVRVAPDAQDIALVTDHILLSRVITNMVKNALEACKPNENVTLGCRAVDGGAEFWVHNPGSMPREAQLQVFQCSFTTKGPGRGLGTYSIKMLSERYLKGKVAFESAPDTGTTFRACYPISLI